MFTHPYVASQIAREHRRGMLTAAARQRLRYQAVRQGAARDPALRILAARLRRARPIVVWRRSSPSPASPQR